MSALIATPAPSGPGAPGASGVPGVSASRSRLDSIKRGLAIMLLPASILPVPLLGPTLLRAPRRLWRQASADIQRMEERHGAAHTRATARTPLASPHQGRNRR